MSEIKELQKLADNQPWLLNEFVSLANKVLPKFLSAKNDDRITNEVNARLIRHFTTQKMLDQPEKVGRNAVYTYRHLLQLLVVRKLLSKNIAAAAIGNLPLQRTNAELESILSETAQLNFTPASVDITWERKEITHALEINIRSDFNFNAQTEEQLLGKIAQALRQVRQLRGGNIMDEALDKSVVEQIFENFKAFFDHPITKERNQEWEESKEGWHFHALQHMTYWALRNRRQLNDIKAKAEITNETKEQLQEKLLKIAPELAVTVQQVFKRFCTIFNHQFPEDEQEKWRQSADGWERMALRKMLYSLFRNRELEHEEAWFLTDKPIPQLKKRLRELASELYQKLPGETEQIIDTKKLKWTKNINHQDGDRWCADFDVNQEFALTWKEQASANANKPQRGDLIILRQRARVTHIVEVLDDATRPYEDNAYDTNPAFAIYRWVKVVWRSLDFENAPHQDRVFAFNLNLQGGKMIDLDNITGIEENFDNLEAFQKNVIKALGLES